MKKIHSGYFVVPKSVIIHIIYKKNILLYVLFRIRLNSFDDEIVARGFRKQKTHHPVIIER